MNPMSIMQLQQRFQVFQQEHPKIIAFFKALGNDSMQEGTIIDIKVTTPDGKEIASNMKITENDIATFKQMMEISKNR